MVSKAERPDTSNPGLDTPHTRYGEHHTIPVPLDTSAHSLEVETLFHRYESREAQLLAAQADVRRSQIALAAAGGSGDVSYLVPRLETTGF